MDSIQTSRLQELLAEGERWVSSLDRSALGFFALEGSILAAAHALETTLMATALGSTSSDNDRESDSDVMQSALDEVTRRLAGYSFPYKVSDMLTPVRGEVFFWLERNGENSVYMETPNYALIRATTEFLRMVADNPDEQPYYAAGISDRAFICRCIADGVDASIASEISGVSGSVTVHGLLNSRV